MGTDYLEDLIIPFRDGLVVILLKREKDGQNYLMSLLVSYKGTDSLILPFDPLLESLRYR